MTLIDLLNHIPAPVPVGVGFVHRIKDEDELGEDLQKCTVCGEVKHLDAYYLRAKSGHRSRICRDCLNAKKRETDRRRYQQRKLARSDTK